jgi:lipopolysaccharide/colanic/teichoic acid biosynthesis glycosyltransferase
LDELPQIFNVLRGEMSVVGPRPDLPEFCDALQGGQRRILELRPGITGAATLAYRHEEQILARQASRMKEYYLTELYPDKVRIDLEYAANASFTSDVRVLARTINAIFT